MRVRVTVAFEQVESKHDRWLLYALQDIPEGFDFAERARRPPGYGRFWCCADRPSEDDDFRLRRVYRTTTVPDNARCEVCGIGIRELQDMVSSTSTGGRG